jgi:predicted AAA+ superfamily ATPase
MIERTLTHRLRAAATRYPVVTLTGPRQSGKTTLCRATFSDLPYANLEHPPTRDFAVGDADGFLAQYPDGAVIDEVQRAPELLSHIQVRVDDHRRPGEFVLTGSQHFALLDSIAQSLAGRTAVLHLLPFSLAELQAAGRAPTDVWAAVLAGGYPPIHDRGLDPGDWLAAYAATYVERDVRQILNVGDLESFRTFLALLAGRVGQLLNLSALGGDAGVSHVTARSWLSVLETSFVAYRARPLHRNLGKRLTKSPKPYLFDSGLLCHLLGIRTPEQLRLHPLRGSIFESWVCSEIVKARAHRGLAPDLHFYRDRRGHEVDVVLEDGGELLAVEIKSGQTMATDFIAPLERFESVLEAATSPPSAIQKILVFAGDQGQRRTGVRVVAWHEVHDVDWALGRGETQERPANE